MYRQITLVSLTVGAIALALIAIAPQKFVKKSILENKTKLTVVRIFSAFAAVAGIAVILMILNSPDLL
ncbi:MAG: hypothetical protein K2I07_02280 [Lachnospiraceae bacterium]|nr:hypothetical protein [Lachnospiraceae bacterium]